MLQRIRRSLAAKLILASALPSAAVLLVGLTVLIAHTEAIARIDPALAFEQLRFGALLGSLLTLTFAGIAVALTTRRFLLKPTQSLMRVMGRAELGEFLVRAKVDTEDELGRLARSFNTMLARVTDMVAHDIERERSLERMERELALQEELKSMNLRLANHVREMELLLEVSSALSGSLDLPQQLEELGGKVCAGLAVGDFALLLLDEGKTELVVEAVEGGSPSLARGDRIHLGEGPAGEAAIQGQTIQLTAEAGAEGPAREGALLAIPLRVKGRVVGCMQLGRPPAPAFSAQDVRLAEAIAAQASLAIANAQLFAQTLELSYTDPLTSVPNRRQLIQRLEQEWTRSLRFGDELSLLMIDLDLFKAVNDTWGHSVGDGVLRSVALVLRRNVRKVDTVARYGGEEFCVLLPRVGKAEALEVAEKLRRAVAAAPLPGASGQPPVRLTISVGVASYGVDASDAHGLIERADQALFDAKRGGRNAVQGAPAVRIHAS